MNSLDKLKLFLGITDSAQDTLLMLALDTVREMILSYINKDELPEALENTLVHMTVAYYKTVLLSSTDTVEPAVTAIERGDTKITYAAASKATEVFDLNNGESMAGWRTILNEYRDLRW